jgi:hypothetical protein
MFVRAEKNQNYSVINNTCFKDPNLSARAKGLFGYVMSLPDGWKIKKYEIFNHFKEGRDALGKAFKELEDLGYIKKFRHRESNGTIKGWDYVVYETPTDSLKNRKSENQTTENQTTDSQGVLLSTKKENTKLLNTKAKENKSKGSANQVLTHWLSHKCLVQHRGVSKSMVSKTNKALSEGFSLEDIFKAIDLYALAISNPKYLTSYMWTLSEFLQREAGFRKYVLMSESHLPIDFNYKPNKKPLVVTPSGQGLLDGVNGYNPDNGANNESELPF